jgi:hypothetical protein
MKLYYAFLACCLAASQFAVAQSNLVIFSPDGLKFYLLLNGEQQNQTPKANIKITGLTDPALKAKIIFEDNSMANIDQTVYFNDEEPNTEYAYEIKNKKGKYKLGYFSIKPIAETKPNASQQVIIYGQPETVTTVVTTTTTNTNPAPAPVVVNTTTNTTNTTVTNTNTTSNPQTITKPSNASVNVSVNVSDPNANPNSDPNFNMNINVSDPDANPNSDPNFNMNINVSDPNANPNSDPNFNMNINISDPNANNNANPNGNVNMNVNVNGNPSTTNTNINTNTNSSYSTTTTTTSTTTTTTPVVAAPAAKNNCAVSMSSDQCAKAAAKVKGIAFDSDQLKAAKTAVEKNCATAAQIKQIAKEMKYEDSKRDFLKYAYNYCTDQANYDEILDVLKHSSDREAVEKITK